MSRWSAACIQSGILSKIPGVSRSLFTLSALDARRHISKPARITPSLISSNSDALGPSSCPSLKWRTTNFQAPAFHQNQTSFFSSSSALYKTKERKSFKYDPNYVKKSKIKKNKAVKQVKLDASSISYVSESDEDMTKLTSAELEERHEPMPDEDVLIEAFTIKSGDRSRATNQDAEISLKELVNRNPKLKQYEGSEFIKYMEFMTMYGFHPEQAVQMLLRHPSLFSNYSKLINESMLTWRSMGYTEKAIIPMLHYYPYLVDQSSLETRSRFAFLASFFTREETMFAILNCVNILYDHEPILKKKLEFLIKSNCHTTKTIVRSLALAYPLKHMKLRHEFLIRAGLFQQDNYYAQHKKLYMLHPKIPRNKYFPPTDVICTSDEDFLRICTDNMLSLNELAAFEELYEKELEKEKELMSDDEEDEEEEDARGRRRRHDVDSDDDEDDRDLGPSFGANNSAIHFSKKDSHEFYY